MTQGGSFSFKCRSCGEVHAGIPAFGAEAPQAVNAIPEAEREERVLLSSDQCIIDDKEFYLRGCLEVPVHGTDEHLEWGVWVSLSEESFARVHELWTQEGRESEPPYFGWLVTEIPVYPSTLSLKTNVHTRPVGLRPLIEIEPTNHPLAVDQREGISQERLREIVETVLHGDWPPPTVKAVVDAHVKRFGEPDDMWTFMSAGAPLLRTDVLVWRADDELEITTFVSAGMSAREMPGSPQHRAELHFAVRAHLTKEQEEQAARFVANVACYPWQIEAPLDWWHTMRDPGRIPQYPSCSSLLLHPAFVEDGLDCVRQGDTSVHILHLVPITEVEREIAARDRSALLDHWAECETDLFTDRGNGKP